MCINSEIKRIAKDNNEPLNNVCNMACSNINKDLDYKWETR